MRAGMNRTVISLIPVDEVRPQPPRPHHQLDVVDLADQRAEQALELELREVPAEAEVRSAAAEPDMRVGLASDVEDIRVGEDRLVAVGRGVVDDDLLALLDRHAADLDVLQSRSAGTC